jgi:phospholipase/carboxylesterase
VPTENETITSFDRGWIFRTRIPLTPASSRIVVLIHGWSGDENSMEIFSRSLPADTIQLFPRGPLALDEGGYGWVRARQETWPAMDVFSPVCSDLMQEIQLRLSDLNRTPETLDLMGFSQGAAVSYALSFLFPSKIRRVAALAGFLPAGASLEPGLSSQSYFIAHGARDETIPVAMARESVGMLQKAGASVQYCEGPSGHKLSANCYAELRDFFA